MTAIGQLRFTHRRSLNTAGVHVVWIDRGIGGDCGGE
jgi:hypothetical protein